MNIQLVRHGSHIIQYGEKRILVDPVLSERNTYEPIPGVENTQRNPLVSLNVDIEHVKSVDGVLVTHTHMDHFDNGAVEKLPKDIKILCQLQDEKKLSDKGFFNIEAVSNTCQWDGVNIVRTEGTHGIGQSRELLNPVSGYVLSASGEPTVYIVGDSVWCKDVEDVFEHHAPEIVVCFGGAAQYQGDTITMGIRDFEEIRKSSPKSHLVILHMEAWNHCELTRAEVRAWAKETEQEFWVHVPNDGEIFDFNQL